MNTISVENNNVTYNTIVCKLNNTLYPLSFDNSGVYMMYVDSNRTPHALQLNGYYYNQTFNIDTSQEIIYSVTEQIINPSITIDIDPTSGESLTIQIYNNNSIAFERTIYYDPITFNHVYQPVMLLGSFTNTVVKITPEFTGRSYYIYFVML